MKAPRFSYVRAANLEQVLELLDRHGHDAQILAGGQSLMPALNMRLAAPRLIIDINGIAALQGIGFKDGLVRIGALARHVEVANSAIIRQHLPLISAAMPHVAHVAVRNRGTFGGSIALADPAAELPACTVALDARFVRGFFNIYYVAAFITASATAVSFASAGRLGIAAGAAALAAIAVVLRKKVIPKMDALGTQIQSNYMDAIPGFRRTHVVAILINIAQLVAIVWTLIAMSRQA